MLLEKVSVVVDKGAVVDEAVDGMGDVVAAVVVDKGAVVDEVIGLIANLLYRQSQGHQFFNFRKFGAKKHLVFLFSTKMFQYMAGLKDL